MKLYRSARYVSAKDTFFDTHLWKYLLFEVLTAVIHPNIVSNGYALISSESWNLKEVVYDVNDILIVLTMWRAIYLIRFVVVWTKYYSDKADRISKMMGYHLSLFFSIRCLIIRYPIRMLGFLTVLVCTILAYCVHILEGPLTSTGYNGYKDISDCMWNMYVTLTTGICY
jgi:hypothetical protein